MNRSAVLMAGILLSFCPRLRGASDETSEILTWLPSTTESIFFVHSPIPVPVPPTNPSANELYSNLLFANLPRHSEFFQDVLDAGILSGMVAGRSFRHPVSEGSYLFEGACFFRLRRVLNSRMVADGTDQPKLQSGVRIHVIQDHWANGSTPYFVALLPDQIVIVSTDIAFLQECLDRRMRHSQRVALPANLMEWRFVDQSAPAWGLRHYVHRTRETDDTSFLYKGENGLFDSGAVGSTLIWDPESKRLVVYYLSQSTMAEIYFRRRIIVGLRDFGDYKIGKIDAGVRAEISWKSDPDVVGLFTFLAQTILGYSVVI